jgi:hypothetical protein
VRKCKAIKIKEAKRIALRVLFRQAFTLLHNFGTKTAENVRDFQE